MLACPALTSVFKDDGRASSEPAKPDELPQWPDMRGITQVRLWSACVMRKVRLNQPAIPTDQARSNDGIPRISADPCKRP